MQHQYYIKPGYCPNQQALTYEKDLKGTYWTETRINSAINNQYYVYQYSLGLLRKYKYNSILDVGSGPPTKIKQFFTLYCKDIVLVDQPSLRQLVKQILPEAQFIEADLENIDLNLLNKFDLIICADVLEHLLNPDNCVNFIKKHLASNGLAVLSTPERDYLRGRNCNHSPKPEHVREWNSQEFVQYIASHGFKIVKQLWFPQVKLSQTEFILSRLVLRFIHSHRWSACQVLVCKLAPGRVNS